jgi:sugar (pentulose or hexulose) kinase
MQMPILVIDVGYTNTKAMLFSADLQLIAARKTASSHMQGADYKIIDPEPLIAFLRQALPALYAIAPYECIVPCAHGATLALLNEDGDLAFDIIDYMSEPPPEIIAAYQTLQPPFSEVYSQRLPAALTHALQVFWQKRLSPKAFDQTKTILPWMQYIAFRLSGQRASEISGMACQTHLLDVNTGAPSSLARAEAWGEKYSPFKKAWQSLGPIRPEFGLPATVQVLTGVHDSNANYLRYMAAGVADFTLLSTGTWSICFNAAANVTSLDPARDTNTNTSVFGQPIACSRFFAGKEFEILSQGAAPEKANLESVQRLITQHTFALPSFTDSGGPLPGSGNKGKIKGPMPSSDHEYASLASLYCALMISQQLDAVDSQNTIIVDGPFSANPVFLGILSSLRPTQKIMASDLKDGTAAGAAILGLMPGGTLPHIALDLTDHRPVLQDEISSYHQAWLNQISKQ